MSDYNLQCIAKAIRHANDPVFVLFTLKGPKVIYIDCKSITSVTETNDGTVIETNTGSTFTVVEHTSLVMSRIAATLKIQK